MYTLHVLRMHSMSNLHAARNSPPRCCRSNARRTLPSPPHGAGLKRNLAEDGDRSPQ